MAFHAEPSAPGAQHALPAGTEDVFFPTADGVTLHGRFATGAEPRTGVTVLYFHGNGGTVLNIAGDAAFLQQRGYDVFVVDYRGYGRSEGSILGEATLKLDGAAAMAWLTRARGIDPKRVVLFGHSLGTTVAADLAVAGPCRAVVLVAPLASALRQAQSHSLFSWLPSFYFDRMTNRFDTVGKIGRSNCPVLIVHGDRDGTIDVAQGRAVYEAARPPKRLIIVPGGGHNLMIAGQPSYAAEVLAFERSL